MNLASVLNKTRALLATSPRLIELGLVETEAEQILSEGYRRVVGQPLARADLVTRAYEEVAPEIASRLWSETLSMASLRVAGRPLQHLIGHVQFLDHEYRVGPDVLIPRPETEVLVRAATEALGPQSSQIIGFEVGVGSGVISIELLAHFKKLKMVASEISKAAQKRAQENALRILGKESDRLTILTPQSPHEVLEPFKQVSQSGSSFEKADFLISNPPYLAENPSYNAEAEITEDVRLYEPKEALFAPPSDLFYFYRKIAEAAGALLKPEGKVFLELPHERAKEIESLFLGLGWKAQLILDLNGRSRVLLAELAQ